MRDTISLIANTGLQFYRFEASLDMSIQRREKFRFVEKWDGNRSRFWIDEVLQLPGDEDLWARRSQLESQGFLSKRGEFSAEIDMGKIELVEEGDFFETGSIDRVVRDFEKKIIPIPYFRDNRINTDVFGPSDWVRIYFEKADDDTLHFSLIVDTTTSDNMDDRVSPYLDENPDENYFSLCENENLTLSYLDVLKDCQWVEDHIKNLFYGSRSPDAQMERPYNKHIGSYIFFIRLLRSMDKLPRVSLQSDRAGIIDVDLVIDVGNSRTCTLLFENPRAKSFDLNKVKKLKVQDMSNPLVTYLGSFSTRLVFKETVLSSSNSKINENNKFLWPSPVRIGFEAEKTIQDARVELQLTREIRNYNSSPKRYLWDSRPAASEWEYHLDRVDAPSNKVYLRGISEQLNSDGSLCKDGTFGTKALFSRKSLMTFVYLEIFSHAIRQMNSIDFRSEHGNPSHRRKLKRIVISCPTAMVRKEQIALRECAADAMQMLNNFNAKSYLDEDITGVYEDTVQIIPSVKDLNYDLENIEKRKDWIYDEATSAQMVFMYGMISHKFGGNANLFYNLFGKPTGEKPGMGVPMKRNLVVGSLDIGGGTSDVMICNYHYVQREVTEITPEPLFWESFNLAGDDLLKELIRQIIIEGTIERDSDVGCTGVIENHARGTGIKDVANKLNGFFGKDSNNIGFKGKLMRTNFINQIALPIISRYMDHANSDEDIELKFEDLFQDSKPNDELMAYFEKHFGFKFDELVWKLSPHKVNGIIESVFSRLIRQIAIVMDEFSCDIVVLSGRPSSFNALEKLFNKYSALTPNRLFNLNKYWIGRWYPFADNIGYVEDPKTIVSVGSLISLMGGNLFKLGNFRINTKYLREKLISTANYAGPINDNKIKGHVLSPSCQEGDITVLDLPFLIGFKNYNSDQYPARVIYSIQMNEDKIREVAQGRKGLSPLQVNDRIERIKHDIRTRMPLKVRLSRDFEVDMEAIVIEEVLDHEGEEISKSYFELAPQTISDEKGYWLDTGEFTLNTRR
jgi:hypothetical protein